LFVYLLNILIELFHHSGGHVVPNNSEARTRYKQFIQKSMNNPQSTTNISTHTITQQKL
jgi:hypothetical protein